MRYLETVEQLEALYGHSPATSLRKETDHLTEEYKALIALSPFLTMSTSGSGGMDCSPKGDQAGFVEVVDSKTLLIPDRRGNNRLDSLRNIVEDPRVGLLFLIPGVGETLRVNGTARLTDDEEVRSRFEVHGRVPNLVIEVTVDSVYFHCSKAVLRSNLWDPSARADRSQVPTCGQMLSSITSGDIDAAEVDRTYPQRQLENLY